MHQPVPGLPDPDMAKIVVSQHRRLKTISKLARRAEGSKQVMAELNHQVSLAFWELDLFITERAHNADRAS